MRGIAIRVWHRRSIPAAIMAGTVMLAAPSLAAAQSLDEIRRQLEALERATAERETAEDEATQSGSSEAGPSIGRMIGNLRRDLELRERGGAPHVPRRAPPAGSAVPPDTGTAEMPGPVSSGLANSWSSQRTVQFSHALQGAPGPITLVLEARSDMPAGQTVSVYRADAAGRRLPGAGMFVMATGDGNVRTAPWTIPAPPSGESIGTANLAVVITNHSGRHSSGDYRITVER